MNKVSIFIETTLSKTFISLFTNNIIIETMYTELDFKSDNTYVFDLSIMLNKHLLNVNLIDEIIVVNGPGYFTGIRSGVIIAKAFFYSLGIKVAIIDSFTFLRNCIEIESDCGILIPASKRECYLCRFNGFKKVEESIISTKDISILKNEISLFAESLDLSTTYSINFIELKPTLNLDYEFVETIDEIKPFYMRSEESLFQPK